MKVVLGTLSALLLLVVLAACGSQEGDPVAEDPGPSPSSGAAPPKAPAPMPTCLPLAVISALASSISCRTSVVV